MATTPRPNGALNSFPRVLYFISPNELEIKRGAGPGCQVVKKRSIFHKNPSNYRQTWQLPQLAFSKAKTGLFFPSFSIRREAEEPLFI